jgi:CubicO group peptidase (beta-lactamase class C family)
VLLRLRLTASVISVAFLFAACHMPPAPTPLPARSGGSLAPADPGTAAAVTKLVEEVRASEGLRATIVRVTTGDQEVLTQAFGESMTGVPATTQMHFRNGAVAISYVSTLLLLLVEEGRLKLTDRVSEYLPDLRHADRVTIGQLAQMTSGYVDYVTDPEMSDAEYTAPFRQWTPQQLIAYSTRQPLLYEPGTNWNYSHTNYVILGLVIEAATGETVRDLLQQQVLDPLGLDNTADPGTAAIPEPALHAFSSERRQYLKLAAGEPFIEESTYWSPSWTITHGAIQTTNIFDLHTTGQAIGSGRLLSPESYRQMVTKDLIGKTTAVKGCRTCIPQQAAYSYGLGIINSGNWLLQNPLFSGQAGAFGYHRESRTTIAVAVTFEADAFDRTTGSYHNSADHLWRRIGALLVPDDPPPIQPR